MPVTAEVLAKRLHTFVMDGPKVWDFARRHGPSRRCGALLGEHGLEPSDDLDLVILHQSNLRMIEAIMAALGLPMERAVTTVESYGNTAAASIPLTLQKGLETGRLRARLARDAVRFRRRAVLGRRSPSLVIGDGRAWRTSSSPARPAGSAPGSRRAGPGRQARGRQRPAARQATAVASSIRAAGGSAEPLAMDVARTRASPPRCASLSRPIDVLVNNAGLQHVAPLEEFPMGKWALLVQVMLDRGGPGDSRGAAGMRKRGFGRIVNIGSIHSLVGSPFKSAYVAAKHGLIGFSKVIALETADTDITINTICPSYVKTPLVDRADRRTIAGSRDARSPRWWRRSCCSPCPKGCSSASTSSPGIAAFLASPAARNITGQTIVVDGGWTAQ